MYAQTLGRNGASSFEASDSLQPVLHTASSRHDRQSSKGTEASNERRALRALSNRESKHGPLAPSRDLERRLSNKREARDVRVKLPRVCRSKANE